MKFRAPAKINLSLAVLGKRPDGFHEIESLMVPLTLADTLEIEPLGGDMDGMGGMGGIEFSCSDPGLPADDGNLAVRAARRFFEAAKLPASVRIRLTKEIPHGAGLGGGSSDAAATLAGLNAMHGSPLSGEAVHALAAEIGSDVPFFLAGSAALCRGRGERVEPVVFAESLPLLLVKPAFGVPTPWAYSRWKDSLELPGVPYGAQEFRWGRLVNDLERPVFEKYLFLGLLKKWLMEQPESVGALMSGSGATCFSVLRDASGGPALEERVKREFGEVWTCLCRGGNVKA